MPKNVQILLRRGALVFGNSYCTLPARMRQGQTARAEPGVSARKNGAPHSYLFLNMTHGDLFLREKHDRIRRLWTFIGKELASMENNVLDWLEVTAAACPDKPALSIGA